MTFFICFSLIMSSSAAMAEESGLFSNLDYPELQVAPRASERLVQLAALEDDQGALLHWTIITSGLSTFAAGYMQSGKHKDGATEQEKTAGADSSAIAMGVGASWMTLGFVFSYKKWATTRLSETKKIQGKDKRSELARERMAEEAISTASDTLGTLKYLSVATNLLAAGYVSKYSTQNNQVYSAMAAGLSLLPLFFPNAYELAWEKQLEYKRKIYTPLIGWNFNADLNPQLSLSWNY